MSERLKLLPCPFCGGTKIGTKGGSSYRWWLAYCGECGAQAGEVRMATLNKPRDEAEAEAKEEALQEWNKRAALSEGWVSVKERLPEPDVDVLVWLKKGGTVINCWTEIREAPVTWSSATIPVGMCWQDYDWEEVTHWRDLPAPPVGKD